jgi:DNA-binding response OmpR family regulator
VNQAGGKAWIKDVSTMREAMRVLVVEDERDLADAIAGGLRREGYAVDLAHAGDEALVKARVYPYDLICLDLNLPGAGGREVCRAIRSEERADGASQPRILMLTARATVDDRIAGLDDGADDYLVKPFELGELAARARALLRRPGDAGPGPLRVGSLELDPARHEASQAGEPLPLTPKEFALLRYFMTRPGEALSEFELLTHVWDENANPLTRTVRVTVMTLRRKLAGDPIETVQGVGYRLREDT